MVAQQFPTAATTDTLTSLFVEARQAAKERKLKIGIYGDAETGKTYFSLTCPEPIYIIDTERGVTPLIHHFKNKRIYVFEVFEETSSGEYDPVECLHKVQKAVGALSSVKEGTVVIDSGSDLWDWCEAYMKEQVAEQARKMCQWDWGIANKVYHDILMKCTFLPTVFVITAQPKPIYSGPGQPTGEYIADWMKRTVFWLDVVIKLEKRVITPAGPVNLTGRDPRMPVPADVRHVAQIIKCRPQRQFNLEIEDITYDKLVAALRPHEWWL